MVKMRVTGSGRSSRCAPPHIVPSAPSVPCSTLGDRRIEGALSKVLRVSDRSLSEICPPPQSLEVRSWARLSAVVSAHHSASHHHHTSAPSRPWGAQPSISWGKERKGIPNTSKVTAAQPRTANRRDTRLNKPSPPMYAITPITPVVPVLPCPTLAASSGALPLH
jgi:hypothetical protein